MSETPFVIALAVAIDLALGDLPTRLHPVAWLGRFASAIRARAPRAPRLAAFVAGFVLVVLVSMMAAGVALAMEASLELLPTPLRVVLLALLLSTTFALRGLLDAGRELVVAYQRDGIEAARSRLSWLCSRDPSGLGPDELANGTIESLAENLSDSVVAPLLFYAFFGLPGAAFYRAVNTLDAMVGYRGEYEFLGKFAARLDDLLNLVPARLSAFCLLVAGAIGGANLARGLRVYCRDCGLTSSPNAGHPMAAAAGLLGLRLDKPLVYVLGAELPAPTLGDVGRSIRLVHCAALVFVFFTIVGTFAHG